MQFLQQPKNDKLFLTLIADSFLLSSCMLALAITLHPIALGASFVAFLFVVGDIKKINDSREG